MRPYTFSKRQFHETLRQHNGEFTKDLYYNNWKQGGTNVRYVKDDFENQEQRKKKYYVLSFDYEFGNQPDEVYFAACPPYSYTYLMRQLEGLAMRCGDHGFTFQNEAICKTVCGLSIPIVTVKKKEEVLPQDLVPRTKVQKTFKEKFIVIMARCHPGQTSGSWVADGLLSQLASNSSELNVLLKHCTIIVLPMLNPDGVFVGNYRTGIAGKDFNRNFNTGRPTLFPEIQSVRHLISELSQSGQVVCLIDLHGHSILRGSFIFGPSPNSFANHNLRNLPQILSKTSNLFKYSSCRFANQKNKIETARVFFQFNQKLLAFTVENSLGLYWKDGFTNQIKINNWRAFGKQIVQALAELIAPEQQLRTATKLPKEHTEAVVKHKVFTQKDERRKYSPIKLHRDLRQISNGETHIHFEKQQAVAQKTLPSELKEPVVVTTAMYFSKPLEAKPIVRSREHLSQAHCQPNHHTQPTPHEEHESAQESDPNLSEKGQANDDNDSQPSEEDLPDSVLAPIHAAIESRDFPPETFRAASNQKATEEHDQEAESPQKEESRKKMLLGRNTNGFREVKFNISRLSPENKNDVHYREYYKFSGEADPYQKDVSFIQDHRKPRNRQRRQSTQTGQLPMMMSTTKQLSVDQAGLKEIDISDPAPEPKPQELRNPRQRINSLTTKHIREVLSFEQELNEQVSNQISNRVRALKEKRNSIFSEKKLFENDRQIYCSPKSIVFRTRRRI